MSGLSHYLFAVRIQYNFLEIFQCKSFQCNFLILNFYLSSSQKISFTALISCFMGHQLFEITNTIMMLINNIIIILINNIIIMLINNIII